jgi:hypothetical protein
MKLKAAVRQPRDAKPKSVGEGVVERHRPVMSKLTAAERQRLSVRAMQLIWGDEHEAPRG